MGNKMIPCPCFLEINTIVVSKYFPRSVPEQEDSWWTGKKRKRVWTTNTGVPLKHSSALEIETSSKRIGERHERTFLLLGWKYWPLLFPSTLSGIVWIWWLGWWLGFSMVRNVAWSISLAMCMRPMFFWWSMESFLFENWRGNTRV